jgi:hypothetical protein
MLPWYLWGCAITGPFTSWVDLSRNHAADIGYVSGLNFWKRRTKIHTKTTQYCCAWIMTHVINDSCISFTLYSTSWTKPWRDPNHACVPGRQRMADGHRSEGDEHHVDFINQWSTLHSHYSSAIEVCLVNMIHNCSSCKLIQPLLNWLWRQ